MGLPVEVNNLMLGSLGGYTVGRSLRFRSSASAYLSRAPATATNRTTFTLSAWVKRGKLGGSSLQSIFGNANGVNLAFYFGFSSNDVIDLHQYDNGTNVLNILTTPVYRDPSAWYHILASVDTTQATASNRAKVYVNGIQVTALGTATYPTQNYSLTWNQTNTHVIGSGYNGASPTGFLFDGYLAEVYNIDGQALTPSSFGAYDTNGVWQPKKYTGTYGTNGFYLPFSNTTSTTTLVQDSSGNGNNWTPNNISLTAGTTYDSMIDSPTNSASSSNYAVMNPLNSAIPLQFGNLRVISSATNTIGGGATFAFPSGQWYWEATVTLFSGASTNILLGITDAAKSSMITPSVSTPSSAVDFTYGYGYTASSGNIRKYAVDSAYGATFTTGDIIGIAYDATNNTITFYKNGTSQGQVTGLTAGTYIPWVYFAGSSATNTVDMNFGQRPFTYTPPSGYKALNTYNLPAPSIANGAQYMAATLYTGNGGTAQTITNTVDSTSFQPDFVWIKSRNSASFSHRLYDSVRGVGKELYSNATNAESTVAQSLTAFASNGFTLGTDTNNNASGTTYVGWQWKGGGTAVTNNSGTISSQVSANTSAGFSIATFTGTGANATVGHGLGVAPSMIFTKQRNATGQWNVYHSSLGNGNVIYLNLTNAANPDNTYWNATSPTSSVFTIGTNVNVNTNGTTYVAYCFAAVRGYSAFGSYTGNGSTDGPFVYLGFRPRFVLIRRSNNTGYWLMKDSSRNGYNQTDPLLYANVSDAEYAAAGAIDILSNGFKVRASNLETNGSGDTLIYAAFAESPFQISRAR